MNKDELTSIVDAHGKWLKNSDDDTRANLHDADLSTVWFLNLRHSEIEIIGTEGAKP